MSVFIHPQAFVEEGANIQDGVSIDRGVIIRKNVTIGKNTSVGPYAVIEGNTTIGQDCRIFSHAVVGSDPQDLKYQGVTSFVKIGNNNVIREFVTINPGTEEGDSTIVGDNNLIMAYSHLAHNCIVGNHCVLANAATLAGYVEICDYVVVGGLVAIHQFTTVGSHTMIGGCSKVVQDPPPFSICDGHPASVKGLNIVGLKRRGFSKEIITVLRKTFKIMFFSNLPLHSAVDKLKEENIFSVKEVQYLVEFTKNSQRGVCRPKSD